VNCKNRQKEEGNNFFFLFAIGKTNPITRMQFQCPFLTGNTEPQGGRKEGKKMKAGENIFH